VLLDLGGAQVGLLAHPANPGQSDGLVELNFAAARPLTDIEDRLRAAGLDTARPTADEAFGRQLQVTSQDGMLIKIDELGARSLPLTARSPIGHTIVEADKWTARKAARWWWWASDSVAPGPAELDDAASGGAVRLPAWRGSVMIGLLVATGSIGRQRWLVPESYRLVPSHFRWLVSSAAGISHAKYDPGTQTG
jgi:hypothetical protein